ncbi:MAG: hypothetical protein COZ06_34025 [Armatimonadetes bacterium CG_4_10_14_3_um_filter_66_18]|nr:MAG: hypothetical protein COS65_28105 [Armatimonadetes bacterium CG06_land_8_20_14_3_00_66_21]PIY36903.1 MAG: hypothetical protein COZ06_34025 [Armatimonadetes bacterium CG_4_10_14_3_um_filter_66_18]
MPSAARARVQGCRADCLSGWSFGGGQDGVVASDIVSPTETRVLQALADCGTTEGAAGVCRVAPCTVKKHVENLFGKLGVHTRVQLVAEGFRLGILR